MREIHIGNGENSIENGENSIKMGESCIEMWQTCNGMWEKCRQMRKCEVHKHDSRRIAEKISEGVW